MSGEGTGTAETHEMGLFEAMRTARTIRYISPEPVSDDLLRKVLTAATWAPNGGNRQPWRFLVVREPELKRRLRDLYLPPWNEYAAYRAKTGPRPEMNHAAFDRMMRAATHLAEHFDEVPAIVIPCLRLEDVVFTDSELDRPCVTGGSSILPAIQNLLLACRAVGLAAALTTLLVSQELEVKKIFGIPDGWATVAFIAVGYPLGKGYRPVVRQPVEQVTCLDHWDKPLFAN